MNYFERRINKLKEMIKKSDLDGILLQAGPNMRYLIDYTAIALERMIVLLIPADTNEYSLILPKLEEERALKTIKIKNVNIISYNDVDNPLNVLIKLLKKHDINKLGVEGNLPFKIAKQLMSVKIELLEADNIMYSMRICKDEEELLRLKRSSEINMEVIVEGIHSAKPGVSESRLMNLMRSKAIEMGADNVPFCLVQSGPRSAMPHAETSTRLIRDGDIVLFDMGVSYEGYISDITRCITIGKPTALHEKIYNIVRRAQEEAIKAVIPGIPSGRIDKIARDIISSEGYGEYFIHRTGHGLGLEVHEEPYIKPGNKVLLREGMVFTVEPGIYLPGRFGIRLEDDIVVVEGGYKNLIRLPKTLDSREY